MLILKLLCRLSQGFTQLLGLVLVDREQWTVFVQLLLQTAICLVSRLAHLLMQQACAQRLSLRKPFHPCAAKAAHHARDRADMARAPA